MCEKCEMLKDLAAKAKVEADEAVTKAAEQFMPLVGLNPDDSEDVRQFIRQLAETVAVVVASKGAEKMVNDLLEAERQLKAAGIDPDEEYPQIVIPGMNPNDPPTEH